MPNCRLPGLCAASALWLGLLAGPAPAQTVQDMLSAMLAAHPDIAAAREDVAASEHNLKRVGARFLPTLTARGDYGYNRVDNSTRTTVNGGPSDQPSELAALTLKESLFNGFRTFAERDQAEAQLNERRLGLRETRQRLLLEGMSAYLNVLQQDELLRIARRNEERIREQLQVEDERVRRGSGLTVDVLQAKTRLQIAKEQRVATEGRLRAAKAAYVRLFASAPDTETMKVPNFPRALVPGSLEEALETAVAINVRLQRSLAALEAVEQQRRIADSGFYPNVDLVAEGEYEDDETGLRKEMFLGVRTNWELFSGFGTRAASRQAARQKAAALQRHDSTVRSVRESVTIAWDGLQTSRERTGLLENASAIAFELFQARRKLRDLARETVINVLDAEREYNTALSRQTAARFETLTAAYRLLFEIGRLTADNLKVAVPGAAD